jgi:DNA replicative helicase MCM subunit Mcm2 (Cdc46/Mcm family)
MTWLLSLFGGKLQLYAVGFLLIAVGVLSFTTYKVIKKNGALSYENTALAADMVNLKKVSVIREATIVQSRLDEAKAIAENIKLKKKHTIETKQLNELIQKLKKEGSTNEQEQKSIDCLGVSIPKSLLEFLYGVQ